MAIELQPRKALGVDPKEQRRANTQFHRDLTAHLNPTDGPCLEPHSNPAMREHQRNGYRALTEHCIETRDMMVCEMQRAYTANNDITVVRLAEIGLEVLNSRRQSYMDLVMRSGKSLNIAVVATRFFYQACMQLTAKMLQGETDDGEESMPLALAKKVAPHFETAPRMLLLIPSLDNKKEAMKEGINPAYGECNTVAELKRDYNISVPHTKTGLVLKGGYTKQLLKDFASHVYALEGGEDVDEKKLFESFLVVSTPQKMASEIQKGTFRAEDFCIVMLDEGDQGFDDPAATPATPKAFNNIPHFFNRSHFVYYTGTPAPWMQELDDDDRPKHKCLTRCSQGDLVSRGQGCQLAAAARAPLTGRRGARPTDRTPGRRCTRGHG